MRTKAEIVSDYRKFLISKGFKDCKIFSDEQILELLLERLYETKEYKGQLISTTDAFWHFCEFVLKNDPASQRRIWNPFVKEIFEMIERNRLTSLMAPRTVGKSFITFILYPLFKSFLLEYYDAILCSNIPKMAKRNFRILNRLIDTNELLLDKKDEDAKRRKEITWSRDEIEYNKGFLEAISMGTTPRSAHVAYIAVDDPLRDDRKYTDEYNENFVLAQLYPCIGRRLGRMVVDGTPQHEKDLFHVLMADKHGKLIENGGVSKKLFYSKVFRAITDWKKKQVLLPDVFSWDELMMIRETEGDLYFAREYMCQCISAKSAIFPEALIKHASDDNFEVEFAGRQDVSYVIACDVATSGKQSADYSAFVVLEVCKEDKEKGLIEGTKIIRYVFHPDKGMEIDKQAEKLEELSKDFNNAFVLVEQNNIGISLIQSLQAKGINIESFVTDRFKKQDGIRFLKNEMKHRRLIIPKETYEIRKLKDELRAIGVRRKKGLDVMEALTGHDDIFDALWIANRAAQSFAGGSGDAIVQD